MKKRTWYAWVAGVSLLCTALAWHLAGAKTFWADEQFTRLAVSLPWSELWEMGLERKDAVHLAYYSLLKFLSPVLGLTDVGLRLPSMVAVGVACALLMTLTKRLLGGTPAVFVGLVFASLPVVSQFGAEARPYAISMALCVLSMLAFVRLLSGGYTLGIQIGYVLALTGATYVALFSILIVIPQWVVLLRSSPSARSIARTLALQAIVIVLSAPLLVIAWSQRQQVQWDSPSLLDPLRLLTVAFGTGFTAGRLVLAAIGLTIIVVGTVVVWTRTGYDVRPRKRGAVELGWAWFLLPGLVLIAVSWWSGFFSVRYVISSFAGLALLIGLTLSLIRRPTLAWLAVAGWVVVALVGRLPWYAAGPTVDVA